MILNDQSYLICLTGGIASGKTVVSEVFEDSEINVIDTDLIARQVVEKDSDGLNKLVKEFGEKVLRDDGSLNRSVLKEIAFSNDSDLTKLNSIIHPLIHEVVVSRIESCHSKIIVVVVPLYQRQPEYGFFDRVLVVNTKALNQVERVMKRDSIGPELASKIISSQVDSTVRLSYADDVLMNNGSLKHLVECTKQLITFYLNMSEI